jgi:hypothetical protein
MRHRGVLELPKSGALENPIPLTACCFWPQQKKSWAIQFRRLSIQQKPLSPIPGIKGVLPSDGF